MFGKVKQAFSKSKALVVTSALILGASAANAAVQFDKTSGFTGDFELNYYYSAIGIVVTAIAVVAAIGLGIRQFKKI